MPFVLHHQELVWWWILFAWRWKALQNHLICVWVYLAVRHCEFSFHKRVTSWSNSLWYQLLQFFKSLNAIWCVTYSIISGGIVGGGVYELVQKCIESGRLGSVGASIEVAKICVRDLDKPRDFALKKGTTLVTDYNDILGDDSINCVVELMGGVTR